VFPARYELHSYILFRRYSVFKGLKRGFLLIFLLLLHIPNTAVSKTDKEDADNFCVQIQL
jgi:hypothetical protein